MISLRSSLLLAPPSLSRTAGRSSTPQCTQINVRNIARYHHSTFQSNKASRSFSRTCTPRFSSVYPSSITASSPLRSLQAWSSKQSHLQQISPFSTCRAAFFANGPPPRSEDDPQSSNGREAREDPSPESRGPLPDLRHGIPSTFEQETSDRSSSFDDSRTGSPPNMNLTEDPTVEGGGKKEGGELPKEAYVSSIQRRRERMAYWLYISTFSAAAAIAVWLGQNWENDREAEKHSDAPNGWSPGAFYARIKARTSEALGYYTEPAFPKLLPEVDPNYKMPYTLVLSLEDLLVHSKWSREKGWEVAKRPGVDYFIRYLLQYYELVLFTSVQSMNADMIVRKLDPYSFISFPLFRESTRYMNGQHVKDLSYLNRDLSKTLIIDTNSAHTSLQPENAIILPKWSGSPKDPHASDLVAMIPFLEYIATMSIEDVRKVLKSYEGTHIPTEFAKREAKAREAFNKRMEEEKKSRRGSAGGLGSLLGFKPSPSPMQIPGEPSIAEGFARGKMISDQMRERGQKQYELLEKQIREEGSKWLEEREREEKKMIEESMKNMQQGWINPSSWFGGSGKQ